MPRPNWSLPLPQPIVIPGTMTLTTLADARALIEKHLPAKHRERRPWRHVAAVLQAAAHSGDTTDVSVALSMALERASNGLEPGKKSLLSQKTPCYDWKRVGEGAGMGSILRFVPRGVFDDATTHIMGEAFDAACRELRDSGQPPLVLEVMAKRIIDAARAGERDMIRLRDVALAALKSSKNRL
jgi:hypothetical protein